MEPRPREQQAGPGLRQAVRAHQSRPIVERIERAVIRLKSSGGNLPQSLLGLAIDLRVGPMADTGSLFEQRPGGD